MEINNRLLGYRQKLRVKRILEHGWYHNDIEKGRRNPRAWHGSRLTVSGLHGHPSTPNPRPKRRVETPGDPWGVPQPPGPSSPAYGTPPT